ncbi:DUF1622 domain-containing protein [Methylocystis sp. B8]|uniref:DUF1622 domain-containing protein n=1 Tax=Methylocystis sp. B8 TaxID=544938 RepID=UPI0010FEDC2A|nr:DUF1622 domain-containing protein [Methylocystis sp. B8]TLG77648.1 DUF1622 domain-containing protein [Methylocystis sp. B8]
MPYLANIHQIINIAGLILDITGVLIIVIGATLSTLAYLARWRKDALTYRGYRRDVGRSILLGLEFLVGGDIIRTVSVEHPSLENVFVLGLIVMIRTAMSFTMEVELEGRWPWQGRTLEMQAPSEDESAQS